MRTVAIVLGAGVAAAVVSILAFGADWAMALERAIPVMVLALVGMGIFGVRLSRRAYWALAGATLVWAMATMLAASNGQSGMEFIAFWVLAPAIGSLTMVMALVCVIRGIRERTPALQILPVALVLQAIALLAATAITALQIPAFAAFELSRPALEAAAGQARGGKLPTAPSRIGLLSVQQVDVQGKSVRFLVGQNLSDEFGFVHSPNVEPPVVGEDSYTRMDDGWWLWSRSW